MNFCVGDVMICIYYKYNPFTYILLFGPKTVCKIEKSTASKVSFSLSLRDYPDFVGEAVWQYRGKFGFFESIVNFCIQPLSASYCIDASA